ncbi:S1 RNA-binding domain-containing protein, partial [Nocardia sp. NPDC003648]
FGSIWLQIFTTVQEAVLGFVIGTVAGVVLGTHNFVKDPREVVKSGDVVKVKVLEVDVARQRIGLSLRLDDEPGKPAQGDNRGGGAPRGQGRGQGRPQGGRGQGADRGQQGRGQAQQGRGGNQRKPAAEPSGSMADALRRAGFGGK